MNEQQQMTSNLDLLLEVVPPQLRRTLGEPGAAQDQLLELILDLGRIPVARYVDTEQELSDHEVTYEDLNYVLARVSDFGAIIARASRAPCTGLLPSATGGARSLG